MTKKTYTVMVVGGAHQEVRRLTIRRIWLTTSAAIAAAILIAGFALSVHYLALSQGTFTAQGLQVENTQLKEQLRGLTASVERVESRSERLDRYDLRLHEMTHVRTAAPELARGPVRRPAGARGGTRDIDGFAVPFTGDNEDAATFQAELMDGHIRSVFRDVERQTASLSDLIDYYSAQEALLASTPSVWPTQGWITSGFGFRSDPFTGGKVMHAGVDLSAPHGTQVLAPAAGTVTFADDRGGYGNMISIDHGRGIVTQYGHLDRILVKVGDTVQRGHHIGAVGNTGRSTGPHLHYEVRVGGVPVNPRVYVLEW